MVTSILNRVPNAVILTLPDSILIKAATHALEDIDDAIEHLQRTFQ